MGWSGNVEFQNLIAIAASSITTGFVEIPLFASGFSEGVTTSSTVMVAVKNGTNGDVLISFDGTNVKWGFPASSGTAYDVRTNSPQVSNLMLPSGTTFQVKWNGSAPGIPTGNLYIELMQVEIA
jgi:hypothetical protein